MDEKRAFFKIFLTLHAHKARATDEPMAHLLWKNEAADPHAPLWRLTRDEVLEALDPKTDLVCRLLEQMRTYHCTRQRIVGCVFDEGTVLSEVLRDPYDN